MFFNRDNYLFFLKKIRYHLLEHLDIVAYCLMPNHFHLLTYTKENIVQEKFSNDLRVMLSSYTRAINKQEGKTGSLFQQNTKIKHLDESRGTTSSGATTNSVLNDHPFIGFHYIHQNPLKAGLVNKMEDYEMSSFQDYAGMRNGTLCDKQVAYELLEIHESPGRFLGQSYKVKIFED